MSRKNIFEILADNYNASAALERIAVLFHSKLFLLASSVYHTGYNTLDDATIEEIVDGYTFCNWKSRGIYLNCRDMRNALGLAKYPKETDDIDTVLVLYYLEYYVNICALAGRANAHSYQRSKKFDMLTVAIKTLIDNLNHKQMFIESEDKTLIVPKNPAGTAVAEIPSTSTQTVMAILKYHHHLLKGNLPEKRKLLQTIANEYEEILKSKSCEPKTIFDNTNALLNNLYIRHGNEKNKKNIDQFSGDELENWYDEIYQMLLLCVLLKDNSVRMKKVDKLLESLCDKS